MVCFFVRFGVFVAVLIKILLDQRVIFACFSEFFALLFSMLTNVQYVYAPAPRDVVACFSTDTLRLLAGIFIATSRGIEYIA